MVRHALVAVIWLCPALAMAQSASESKAAANALFDEGKRLIAAGDVDHACSKFEASLQLVDQLGVRLNLADCHERQGRTATAWAEFREAASQADMRGDARAAFAHQRADALQPRLAKLQIAVPATNQRPGLTVRRDGATVPSEAFGTVLPVDPGRYTIEASATGCRAWSTHVEVTKAGEVVMVEIPQLVAVPVIVEDNPQHRRHLIGLGVGAGGVAAMGAGIVLGLEARSKWGSVGTHCDAKRICDATGVSINHSARLLGNVGTIVGGLGLAAAITGAVLYVTAPAARPVIEHAHLDADKSSGVQIGFGGRF